MLKNDLATHHAQRRRDDGRTVRSAADVLARVKELVPQLRSRASETEKLRRMHPDNLAELTEAGVFKLTTPADVGGYEADDDVVAEVLGEIARGCPSTGWICTIIVVTNLLPAMVSDDVADEVYATPDLRVTGIVAPTGEATPVAGGYRVSGRWAWNTGGVHSNWVAPTCLKPTEEGPVPIVVLVPVEQVQHQDTWYAAGLAGSATNAMEIHDVFVPESRTLPAEATREGVYAMRRYTGNPYYNRPWLMYAFVMSAPTLLGAARGAMDVFMESLRTRGQITYTGWTKAAEAPLLHRQLATAKFELETAEMYMGKLLQVLRSTAGQQPSFLDRISVRAWGGQVATHARACVNQLFEASGASQCLLTADLQRYFRDANVLHQHAAIQPNSSDELYGRILAGMQPDTDLY
jgi:3-hydroxy-9,10-secoandrosta-1,3,5(10)-triene-9,17-dione monooxygenase